MLSGPKGRRDISHAAIDKIYASMEPGTIVKANWVAEATGYSPAYTRAALVEMARRGMIRRKRGHFAELSGFMRSHMNHHRAVDGWLREDD